jgi:hypothetical protein
MIKKLVAFALAMVLAVPAVGNAMDMEGKFGLGYWTGDAPVGGRYWVTPQVGVDIGLGYMSHDGYTSASGDKESAAEFYFEIGVPYVAIDTDRANLLVRPGFQYGSIDGRLWGYGTDDKISEMIISITPCAEVFFGDHFSLTAGHGIQIQMISWPDATGYPDENYTNIRTFGDGVTNIGFHFYFK